MWLLLFFFFYYDCHVIIKIIIRVIINNVIIIMKSFCQVDENTIFSVLCSSVHVLLPPPSPQAEDAGRRRAKWSELNRAEASERQRVLDSLCVEERKRCDALILFYSYSLLFSHSLPLFWTHGGRLSGNLEATRKNKRRNMELTTSTGLTCSAVSS